MNQAMSNDADDLYDDDYKLRSYLDDLIDDRKTEQCSEIVQGLEKLADCNDNDHKAWALNKLSDIYLKGFGPIPNNLAKALDYNQQAMDLNNHKAFSNRAACYFMGLGVEKNLKMALEFAKQANELSKSNRFSSDFSTREGGGLYENLISSIRKEMKKQNKAGN